MGQFDESKHNRHSDGKFANKVHAEAEGISLEGEPRWLRELTDLEPRDQERVIEQLRANQISKWGPRAYFHLLQDTGDEGKWPADLPIPDVGISPDLGYEYMELEVGCYFPDEDYSISMTGGIDQDEPLIQWGPNGDAVADEEGERFDRPETHAILGYAYSAGQELMQGFGAWNPNGADGAAADRFAFPTMEHAPACTGWDLGGLDEYQQTQAMDVLRAKQIDRFDPQPPIDFPEGMEPTDVTVEWNPWRTNIEGYIGDDRFDAVVRGDGPFELDSFRWNDPFGREGGTGEGQARREALRESLEEMGTRAHDVGRVVGTWDNGGVLGKNAATSRAATKHILGQ